MLGLKKKGLWMSGLIGLAAAVLLTGLICLGMTPLFLRGILPLDQADTAAPFAVCLAVFLVVLLLTKSRGRQVMPTAGIVAGGFILLSALLCALAGQGHSFGAWLVRTAAGAVTGSLFGAIMSIRRKPSRRRHRH